MKAKFETASDRVKGLSFHPSRPWILASLHTGSIQLWDYRIETLLDRFDEHEGPVRGICFHSSQPLFVSGGDDYRIKVWNYKLRRCLFTLLGHLDYIRTVEFHHEQPWILSASDDQTIRIWNWQSRECVSVFTGHNHYVMSAKFHPNEDLVVSSSLDQTVRVWDISGLHKKNANHSSSMEDSLGLRSNDIFGSSDVVVKYLLEGHDRGVNWADFSNKHPFIVSGADDRQIKLWRMNDTKAWEVDTLRGHLSNVSCVLFHPRRELLLSNSEDKTIRVWDMAARNVVKVIRREDDRFWTLVAHPTLNLFAAGHDHGLVIFKLERERPVHAIYPQTGTLFYISDGPNRRYLRSHDLATRRDVSLISLRRSPGYGHQPRMISYNAAENTILITSAKADGSDLSAGLLHTSASSASSSTMGSGSSSDDGTYELYRIPSTDARAAESPDAKRGKGLAAIFVARNRFVVLERQPSGLTQLVVKNLENENTRTIEFTEANVDYMFAAGTGQVLLRAEDKVILYDVQRRRVVAELATQGLVKDAIWSSPSDKASSLILMCKNSVILTTRKLEQICSVQESIPIKSGAWDDSGVFVYTTLNHIKYLLPNGDNGIIRTVDIPIYITAVRGNRIYCLDRDCQCQVFAIDPTEYLFKLALYQRRFDVVMKMVQQSHLIGQSIISYLQRKGYPDVALHFVKDERSRFNLALECGNIEVALESAKKIDDADCWNRLATEALAQGNHQVVEMAYQRTKNFEKLSFLYLITGNQLKLQKMMKIAEIRKDSMGRFHNSLYLGDVEERVRVLRECGQLPLAYLTAQVHGLEAEAAELLEQLTPAQRLALENEEKIMAVGAAPTLMIPSTPIIRSHESNWPLLTQRKSVLHDVGTMSALPNSLAADQPDSEDEVDGEVNQEAWGGCDLVIPGEEGSLPGAGEDPDAPPALGSGGEDEVDGWGGCDLDLPPEDLPAPRHGASQSSEPSFVAPKPGLSMSTQWTQLSKIAWEHIAAGSFDTAMQLLFRQAGIVNFAPLKQEFLALYESSHCFLPTLPSLSPLATPIFRKVAAAEPPSPRPLFDLAFLAELLKRGYRSTLEGKFKDALLQFTELIHKTLFTAIDDRSAAEQVQQLIEIAREYATAMRLELHRKTNVPDPVRSLELSALFTHFKLQSPHLQLALRAAMTAAYKLKNFNTAGAFARRLIDLHPKPDIASQARQVARYAEQHPTDEHQLNYDERNPFVTCGFSFVPIYLNTPSINCPFCGSTFLPEHHSKVCPTCQLAQIGAQASGLFQIQKHLYPQR